MSVLSARILLVQFVAFGGALLFGRIAARFGSRRTILGGLVVWVGVVWRPTSCPPRGVPVPSCSARSSASCWAARRRCPGRFYSQLIPRGREAEYFSLYQAGERGTSWLGTLVFGLVHQLTDSYRPAIIALVVFFVVGFVLLWRVDTTSCHHRCRQPGARCHLR